MKAHRHRHFVVRAAGLATVVELTEKSLSEDTAQSLAGELFHLAGNLVGVEMHLDLEQVEFLGSTALGKLLALHKRVRAGGGRLRLVNVDADLYELFTLTRLDTLLDVRRKGAVASPAAVSA